MKEKYLRSPIPYMGSKYKLLKDLIPLFPKECDIFVDLFGGSGTVSMNYQGGGRTIYNEFNHNIVELIKVIVNNNPEELDKYWKAKVEYYKLPKKSTKRENSNDDTYFTERQNNYNQMRKDYNSSKERDYRDLYLLSCFSINHLIRFNSDSQFNASSGNDSYNEVNFERVKGMHEKFKNVEISEGDALTIDLSFLTNNSFVYCDCPYLNTEAVYNEKRAFGGWTIESDYKLFKRLEELNEKGIKWGLSNVFENRGKRNDHLIEWCNKNNWTVVHLDRNYNPFSRGLSNNDEVYICNYNIDNDNIKKDNNSIQYSQVDFFDLI